MVPERRTQERRLSERRAKARAARAHAPAWRTSCNIIGYSIEALDGPLGTVEAFCMEEESSTVTGIVVAAAGRGRNRKRTHVPLSAVIRVNEAERKLYLASTRAELRRSST